MPLTAGPGARTPRRPAAAYRRRFRSLAVGEAFNVVWLPLVFLGLLEVPASPANLTGLGLLVLFLVEGAGYWAAKVVQLDRGLRLPPGIAVFARLRAANLVLLAAGLAVVAAAAVRNPGATAWPGLGFWLAALAEHVNYFHLQLMPTPSWSGWRPRRSRLARDLAAARPSTPPPVPPG
jgi:hypothetical protein